MGLIGNTFSNLWAGFLRGLGLAIALAIVPVLIIAVVVSVLGDVEGPDFSGVKIKTDHAVGVVDLEGEILTSDKLRRSLEKFTKNDKVRAIVVHIDSPGGGVGASEEIYNYIREADQKKPVVCALGSIAASGGLYSAAGCRKIVSNKGTLTGSIGVIAMMPNFASILDRVGVSMNVIKSGKYKDSGSPFRAFEPEDRAILQELIDKSYAQFVQVVADSRKLPVEEVKKFADGRVILGEEAVKLGLVDEIGGVERAAKIALELAGDEQGKPEILYPSKKSNLQQILEPEEYSFFQYLRSVGKVYLLYRAFL